MSDRCTNEDQNNRQCTCTYEYCSRKGRCCECLQYHWANKELPGCLFPKEAEAGYDRSLKHFIQVWQDKV